MVAPEPPLAADGVVLHATSGADAAWITATWKDPDIARFIVETTSPFAQRWSPGTEVEDVENYIDNWALVREFLGHPAI